jgi:hypothetical protein
MKSIIIVALFLLPGFLANAQNKKGKFKKVNSIIGKYRYLSQDKLSGITLTLNPNGTFDYDIGGDLVTYHSKGKWKKSKDTLILNSSLVKENIPLSITEEVVDSIQDYVHFNWINNLDNDAINATLSFNGDTLSQCEPFTGTNCQPKVGSIDSILVWFSNGAKSRWFQVKNRRANKISVTVSVHDVLERYIYLKNEKYLCRNGILLYLTNDVTINNQAKIVLSKVYEK